MDFCQCKLASFAKNTGGREPEIPVYYFLPYHKANPALFAFFYVGNKIMLVSCLKTLKQKYL